MKKTELWLQGSPSVVGGWGARWVGETQTSTLAVQCDRCNCTGTSGRGAQRMQTTVGRIPGGCQRGRNAGWLRKGEDISSIKCCFSSSRGRGETKSRGSSLLLPYTEWVRQFTHSCVQQLIIKCLLCVSGAVLPLGTQQGTKHSPCP